MGTCERLFLCFDELRTPVFNGRELCILLLQYVGFDTRTQINNIAPAIPLWPIVCRYWPVGLILSMFTACPLVPDIRISTIKKRTPAQTKNGINICNVYVNVFGAMWSHVIWLPDGLQYITNVNDADDTFLRVTCRTCRQSLCDCPLGWLVRWFMRVRTLKVCCSVFFFVVFESLCSGRVYALATCATTDGGGLRKW